MARLRGCSWCVVLTVLALGAPACKEKLDKDKDTGVVTKDTGPVRKDLGPAIIKDGPPVTKDTGPVKPDSIPTGSCKKTVAAAQDKDVDILVVMDNSNSMEHEQKNLANNFPKFVEALKTPFLGGKIPNVRIGVVSTDLGAGNYNLPSCETTGGDGGKLQSKAQVAGCTPPTQPWISYENGKTNVPGSGDPVAQVKQAFTCIAQLGTGGCGFEQTLMAARKALDPTLNVNPGFFRNNYKQHKDALLAVIFVSDEDDCSAKNPQLYDPSQQGLTDPLGPLTSFRCFEFGVSCQCPGSGCKRTTLGPRTNCVPSSGSFLHHTNNFINMFRGLKKTPDGKAYPRRVIMAALAGPTDKVEVGMDGTNPVLKPSCQSAAGFAVPGVRLKSVVHAFSRELTPQEVGTVPHWKDKAGKFREENYSTICTSDFGPALQRFAKSIVAAMGTRCAP